MNRSPCSFVHHDYPVLKQINSSQGRYYTLEGSNKQFKYPSVTSVVGILNKESILRWRQQVGEEEANRISSRAANRGTRIHSLCENYLKGDLELSDPGLADKEVFKSLIPELNKIENIHALEQRLFSHRLQVAGTVDAIANFDGVLSVIDFKTSKRVKPKEWITSYFLQTAAYSYMFYELTGLIAKQLVIIMGVDGEREPSVFIEKSKDWIDQFIVVRQTYRELYEKV